MKRIAHLTDIHLDEKLPIDLGVGPRANWQLLLDDVATRQVDEIIFGGDIGEKEANEWFFNSLKPYKLKITLGNHDHFSEVTNYYKSQAVIGKEELYEAYEEGGYCYIFLDSSSGAISHTQFQWLQEKLQTDQRILVFMHHPILDIGSVMDREFPLKGREQLNELLQTCTQEVIIFCGHYHTIDQRTDRKATQYITPASSFQLKKDTETIEFDTTTFGYRLITIDKEEIHTEVMLYQDGRFIAQ